jgi:hypothetical protein
MTRRSGSGWLRLATWVGYGRASSSDLSLKIRNCRASDHETPTHIDVRKRRCPHDLTLPSGLSGVRPGAWQQRRDRLDGLHGLCGGSRQSGASPSGWDRGMASQATHNVSRLLDRCPGRRYDRERIHLVRVGRCSRHRNRPGSIPRVHQISRPNARTCRSEWVVVRPHLPMCVRSSMRPRPSLARHRSAVNETSSRIADVGRGPFRSALPAH